MMQLMPQTASNLGVKNAFDPEANVAAGTRYLRELLERYNFDLIKALAAYNAGPAAVDHYRGIPPYRETRIYVARVIHEFNRRVAARKREAGRVGGALVAMKAVDLTVGQSYPQGLKPR